MVPLAHFTRAAIGIAALGFLSALGGAVSVSGTAQDRLPPGEGRVTVESLCATRCHTASTILKARRTPTGWEVVLDKMVERGAEMSDSEYDVIFDYLSQRLLATVNANTAPLEALVEVLEISEKEAAAIVEGRKKVGILRTWEDVAKLPGVDAAIIEERKARLVFE